MKLSPSGQNSRKSSVFLTTWHCILSAELTKRHSFRLFFGDFFHWTEKSLSVNNTLCFCFLLVGPPYTMHFRVKFYPVEPHKLREELTRFGFLLNIIHKDIFGGGGGV